MFISEVVELAVLHPRENSPKLNKNHICILVRNIIRVVVSRTAVTAEEL